ncbi:MAG: hypothetical protein IKP10_03115 [Clostridia bacterium]|nr:hypothetical protein [Clostridia bacterium]
MKASLVCIGTAGARIAEAIVYCAFCGALPREDVLRVNVLFPPKHEDAHLRGLYASYGELRAAWQLRPHTGLAPILSLRLGAPAEPLVSLSRTADDRALLQALLPADEISAPSMAASGRAARAAWEQRFAEPDEAMRGIVSDAEEMPVVVLASLAESAGSTGVQALTEHLRGRDVNCVLITGLSRDDSSASARRALTETAFGGRFLALAGLPEDCRSEGDGPHLLHLICVRALDAFLAGEAGSFAFRAPTHLDWRVLDPGGERWGHALDALIRFDTLWSACYAPEALRVLREKSGLRDRMTPWMSEYLFRRGLDGEARDTAIRQISRAAAIAHGGACFLRDLQRSLPFVLRPTAPLREAQRAAEAHYDEVLRTAGQLAMLEHDIRESGMAQVTVIHRHDMQDSEPEIALREREEKRLLLEDQAAEQARLDLLQGGRLRREMLRRHARETRAEAENVRAQAEEADRRIRKAATVAKPEDMPRVDQARARLRRMQRRLADLEGRAARAEHDLALSGSEEARLQPPTAEGARSDSPADELWPAAWLDALCALNQLDPKARARQAQLVLTAWPWPQVPARSAQERVLRETPDGPTPALCLIEAVQRACR